MTTIIADETALRNDTRACIVVKKIEDLSLEGPAVLYHNFPLYRGDLPDEIVQAQLLLLSPRYGVVCFKCLDTDRRLDDAEKEYLDDLYVHVTNKFNAQQELRDRRRLIFPVNIVVVTDIESDDASVDYVGINDLQGYFDNIENCSLSDEQYVLMQSCIEGTKKLIQKKQREVEPQRQDALGAILNRIQNQEAVFDVEQKRLALHTIDTPQRIRGLAGSGKTIVLTMKAAQFHLRYPDADILYTYYTKSLYAMVRTLIERFYRDFSNNREPDWRKIHILHAWGGHGLAGVYSEACAQNDIQPVTYGEAVSVNRKNPFGHVCNELLGHELRPTYDLTLIDEGQDFPNSFYQLCYKLSKSRRIVWAYDDFQNIFDVNLQNERETFGKDEDGNYRVDFSRRENANEDVVLHTCYRTPRYILVAAFALGLGIYNKANGENVVLQRLEDNEHWRSLGFEVEQGNSSEGCDMVVSRPVEHSPSVMNEELKMASVIWRRYDRYEEECTDVAASIVSDIRIERLLPEDVCVICLDDKCIRRYYETLEVCLRQQNIPCFNMLDAASTNKMVFYPGKVTLATINKIKGNEAGKVYIVGVDRISAMRHNVLYRNRLFTAMTRAKGWVVLTGTGNISAIHEELSALKENNLKLVFKQPSKESTRYIQNVSTRAEANITTAKNAIKELQESGMSLEDILIQMGLKQRQDE